MVKNSIDLIEAFYLENGKTGLIGCLSSKSAISALKLLL
jgi:hypothetical protein